jgi:CRISPR-associated endonuclease Csn1
MKFKHVLGLDIGTNSLGWSLVREFEDGTIEIVKTGVHIFPIGTIVDDKNNKEKTRNEQRRAYRGASRMRYRFKLRRKNLKKILCKLNMLPDYSDYHKAKGKGQSYELYKLRADAINPAKQIQLTEIGRIFMLLNKYRGFKSNSKKLQQNDKEIGEVKKGYESLQRLIDNSGAQTIGEYFFKMHELGKEWYEEDRWHNPNEPIDERAYNQESGEFILFNSNGIRRHHGRYTLRDMYLLEFDKIWAAQKNYYPNIFTGSKNEYDEIMLLPYKQRIEALKEFKKTNYWYIRDYCIYFQRPLKSQKRYVSNCQFERGDYEIRNHKILENDIEKVKEERYWKKKAKKASPKSHPYFQEFRIWQKLHQINYSSTEEDVFKKPLKAEWLKVLANSLMENFELFLNKTPKIEKENKIWFGKILKDEGLIRNTDNYSFFIDKSDEEIDHEEKNENKITGNVTYASFLEALGRDTFNQLKNETIKRKEHKSKNEIIEVEESKLLQLWHHLYIAKDGLFKEDDWLKCILTEPNKWNFTPEQSDNLISKGLIADYGSYSIKVLKAILPEMRKGIKEYDALKSINRGYVNDDNTIGKQIILKDKISQLKYQELRNPVVERALSKTIKLVNAILKKYENIIDRETFEIRIESTRQFRKPRQERENERRKNADKDKLRDQYADYLNKKNKDLNGKLFSKHIYKNDPIITIYELWLEMNMNEKDELFEKEFKAFSKITKKEDQLKHRLWLECDRTCPYTGRIINLTDCFSSEVEIEHIIPLSRCLDNSYNNKTLTYSSTNAEKGKMTPLEYMKRKGGNALKEFESRIKNKLNKFSDSKKEKFLADKIAQTFSSNQLSNTSYIAKYTMQKMKEVCKNVHFTNGSATSELRNIDWRLSNLLDKIRYQEDYEIDMDLVYDSYYRLKYDFKSWCEKKYNSSDLNFKWKDLRENKDTKEYFSLTNNDLLYWYDEVEKFNQFRNKDGKKDRSDHRHHAIDAFITACCSPRIIQQLSTFNAAREEQHLEYREKIDKNFNYLALKESIRLILVSHSEKQSFIKKRINKIKTSNGVIEQISYAPQGKLHEESFYGKRNGATVRRVELFDDQRQEKNLFDSSDDLHYKVNGETKWNYIDDSELYSITKKRLEVLSKKAFTKEQMENNPFFRVSSKTPNELKSIKNKKPLPIVKSVRKRFNTDRTLIHLPAKDESGKIINDNRFVDNNSNSLLIIYEKDNFDKKGKTKKVKREYELIPFMEYINNKNPNKNKLKQRLFQDEKNGIGLKEYCHWLTKGDFIVLYDDKKQKEIYLAAMNTIPLNKIFKIKGLSSDSRIISGTEYSYGYASIVSLKQPKKEEKVSHSKFNFIKIRLNILGEICAMGEECF